MKPLPGKILKLPHDQAVKAAEDFYAKEIAYGDGFDEINAVRVKQGFEPFPTRAALRAFLTWQAPLVHDESETKQ